MRPAPGADAFRAFLTDFAAEVGSAPLCPNELRAVVRILQAYASEASSSSSGGGGGGGDRASSSYRLYVPDSAGQLVPSGSAVFADLPGNALAMRILAAEAPAAGAAPSLGGLRLVHPWVPQSTCRLMGLLPLSARVREVLLLPPAAATSDATAPQRRAPLPPRPASVPEAVVVAFEASLSDALHSLGAALELGAAGTAEADAAAAVGTAHRAPEQQQQQQLQNGETTLASPTPGGAGSELLDGPALLEALRAQNAPVQNAPVQNAPVGAALARAVSEGRLDSDDAAAAAAVHARLRSLRVRCASRLSTGLSVDGRVVAAGGASHPLVFTEVVDSGAIAARGVTVHVAIDDVLGTATARAADDGGGDASDQALQGATALLASIVPAIVGILGGAMQSSTAGLLADGGSSYLLPPATLHNELPVLRLLLRCSGLPAARLVQAATMRAPVAPAPSENALNDNAFTTSAAAVQSLDRRRGAPGYPLTAFDVSIARVTPLRAFQVGEIVAVPVALDPPAEGADPMQSPLVYGVVQSVQLDGTWGGLSVLFVTLGARVAAAAAAASRAGELPASAAASALSVRSSTLPLRLRSTLVFSFRSARERARESGASHSVSLAPSAGPRDATAHPQGPQGGPKVPSASEKSSATAGTVTTPLGDADVLGSVSDVLRRVGLSLSSDQAEQLAEAISLRRQLADTQASAASAGAALREARAEAARLQAEADARRASLQCPICCSLDVDSVLVPCGHAICRGCAGRVGQQCPFDRAPVRAVVKLFLPQ